MGARTVQRPPLGCGLTKLRLIPSVLAKSPHPPCSRRLCLGNPPGSGADLCQQSTFVRQTSGLRSCSFFFFFSFLLFSLLYLLPFFLLMSPPSSTRTHYTNRCWTLLVCRREIKNKRAAAGCILESEGQELEQEETWQQKGSPDPAGAQPALSLRSPRAGEGGNLLFAWGDAVVLWGKVGGSKSSGGFPSGGPALVEGSPGPVSVLHGASQQEAPIAPPWVLLHSTYAWCQGRLLPAPFWSPTLGCLPIPSFKRHFWGCRRVLR